MILKYHPLGRARAGPGDVGAARLDPTSESWPPAKTVGFEIFLQFENITKRDIKRDLLAIFVRKGMS